MIIEGVDYAESSPDPNGLYTAGKRFAVRYGGPGGDWKHLTSSEAVALDAAGLAIVANAEGTADGLLGGWSSGVDWASRGDAHFRSLGMPAGRPIYLSVDFDVTSAQWPRVAEALRGAASVIGANRVGVYGSHDVMRWARRDWVAAWFWQTYAWSNGVWATGNHIEQYRNGVIVAGGQVDLCRAMMANYGQWRLDMQLTDKLASGVTVGGALDTLLARSNYLANVLGLAGRLDAILAAALDDGDTTVVLDPQALAELAALRDAVRAVPAATVAAFGADLAD